MKIHPVAKEENFDESKHPRDDHGRFDDAGGGGGSTASHGLSGHDKVMAAANKWKVGAGSAANLEAKRELAGAMKEAFGRSVTPSDRLAKGLQAMQQHGLRVDDPTDKFFDGLSKVGDVGSMRQMANARISIKYGVKAAGSWSKNNISALRNFEHLATELPNGHVQTNKHFTKLETHKSDTRDSYAHYQPSQKKISLSDRAAYHGQQKGDMSDLHEFRNVVAHEIGHSVHDKLRDKLPGKADQFAKLGGWSKSSGFRGGDKVARDIHQKPLITRYAETNTNEHFAETYSVYHLNRSAIDGMLARGSFSEIRGRNGKHSAEEVRANADAFKFMRDNVFGNSKVAKILRGEIEMETEFIEKAGHSGIMVALYLPQDIQQQVAVKDDPDAEAPSSLHVTLGYLPDLGDDSEAYDEICECLEEVAKDFAQVEGWIGGIGRFNGSPSSDNKDVYYASFNCPVLPALHTEVVAALEEAGFDISRKHGFTPHVTLKYVGGDEMPIMPKKRTDPFKVPELSVVSGPMGRTDIEFSGERILKDLPSGSSVHVPTAGSEKPMPKKRKRQKELPLGAAQVDEKPAAPPAPAADAHATRRSQLASETPLVDNLETEMLKAALEYPVDPTALEEELPDPAEDDDAYPTDIEMAMAGISKEDRSDSLIDAAFEKADWDESQHPRDDHGRFGDGGGPLKDKDVHGALRRGEATQARAETHYNQHWGHTENKVNPITLHNHAATLERAKETTQAHRSNPTEENRAERDSSIRELHGRTEELHGILGPLNEREAPTTADRRRIGNREVGGSRRSGFSAEGRAVKPGDLVLHDSRRATVMSRQGSQVNVKYDTGGRATVHSSALTHRDSSHEQTRARLNSMARGVDPRVSVVGGQDSHNINFPRHEDAKTFMREASKFLPDHKFTLSRIGGNFVQVTPKVKKSLGEEILDNVIDDLFTKDRAQKIAKALDGRVCTIRKVDAKKQVVYCVVSEPHTVDAQEDWMTPEDIENTAHLYMMKSRVIGKNHEAPINAVPVESYIAPQDLHWEGGPYGPQLVKKGSWVIGIKVFDPKEWAKVEQGDYQGVSISGMGQRSDI